MCRVTLPLSSLHCGCGRIVPHDAPRRRAAPAMLPTRGLVLLLPILLVLQAISFLRRLKLSLEQLAGWQRKRCPYVCVGEKR